MGQRDSDSSSSRGKRCCHSPRLERGLFRHGPNGGDRFIVTVDQDMLKRLRRGVAARKAGSVRELRDVIPELANSEGTWIAFYKKACTGHLMSGCLHFNHRFVFDISFFLTSFSVA